MKQKTIKTKSHAVQPEEIRLDCGSEILENSKLKTKSFQAHERRKKKWLCWLKLHKKFHEKVFGAIRWSSENRKKLEVFSLFLDSNIFFLCAFEVIIIKSRFSSRAQLGSHLIPFENGKIYRV